MSATAPSGRVVVVTGCASGMGAATAARLRAAGDNVIGVDVRDADIDADLEHPEERRRVVEQIAARSETIDAIATFAGLSGLTGRPGSLLASVNYFGTVEIIEPLRPLLAGAPAPAVLVVSSNSITTSPQIPGDVVEACLAHDEHAARAAADRAGSVATYPATKLALARWTRRHAPTAEWAGSGITLNALAPGSTWTPMVEAVHADPVIGPFARAGVPPRGVRATADELAAVATFLLGPAARAFIGSVVYCDGGTDAAAQPDRIGECSASHSA